MKKFAIFILTFSLCALLYGQWEDTYEIRNAGFRKIKIIRYTGRGMTDLKIPENMYDMLVTAIDPWAFRSKNLSTITLPSAVERIGDGAFSDNGLVSIVIPERVRSIGCRAFKGNKLTNVVLSSRLLSLGEGAFEDNELTALSIPEGLRSIGDWAFHKNKITNVGFSDGLRSIGKGAFAGNNISAVIFPDSVRFIKDYAFSNNQLNRIAIGNNVKITVNAIDHGAFYQCYHNEYGRRAGIYIKNEKTNEWSLVNYRTIDNKTK